MSSADFTLGVIIVVALLVAVVDILINIFNRNGKDMNDEKPSNTHCPQCGVKYEKQKDRETHTCRTGLHGQHDDSPATRHRNDSEY